jgi:hypothetical protein
MAKNLARFREECSFQHLVTCFVVWYSDHHPPSRPVYSPHRVYMIFDHHSTQFFRPRRLTIYDVNRHRSAGLTIPLFYTSQRHLSSLFHSEGLTWPRSPRDFSSGRKMHSDLESRAICLLDSFRALRSTFDFVLQYLITSSMKSVYPLVKTLCIR